MTKKTKKIVTKTEELKTEDLERAVGGITDGTSNTIIAVRKAGGGQPDLLVSPGAEKTLIGLL